MDHYAVFGNPIAQSKSPFIHRQFAQQTEQALDYQSQLVAVDGFKAAADTFFSGGGRGLNITSPFKGDAYQYATQLTERARRAGAVNTLARQQDGKILGDTTDGVGLVNDMRRNLCWALAGKSILILGAGGAARGVLEALFEQAPSGIIVANRTSEKAQALAAAFAELGTISGLGLDQLAAQPEPFDVVINATSAALSGEQVWLPSNIVGENTLAYDMIYRAEPTPFMRWCESLGAQTSDGLGMLVGQAAESFKVWRGVEPNVEDIIVQLRAQLRATTM